MDTTFPTGHIPVLLREVLDLAQAAPGMRIVDATLGGGGYTLTLLDQVGESGQVMAFDWDKRAIDLLVAQSTQDERIRQALAHGRLTLVNCPYSEIASALGEYGWSAADIIVADLGLSSTQLDDPERGLSFLANGPLDMRLNTSETVTAADIVNQWDETALATLFRVYGDEGEAERIAKAIVLERRRAPILRTQALAELVKRNVVPARRRGRIHPATKVFQALRMAVNSERQQLEAFLVNAFEALAPGGRLIIVAFHSGEDSLVKQFFRERVHSGLGELLTKKAIQASPEEVALNPRSRSAKLRGIQKE